MSTNTLHVEGGYGAGSVITYDLIAFGKASHVRARVTEPEPGRVLVEAGARNPDPGESIGSAEDPLRDPLFYFAGVITMFR